MKQGLHKHPRHLTEHFGFSSSHFMKEFSSISIVMKLKKLEQLTWDWARLPAHISRDTRSLSIDYYAGNLSGKANGNASHIETAVPTSLLSTP